MLSPSARAKLTQRLMDSEGFVPHAYQDSLGLWTVGYGTLIDKRKGGGLTEDEGRYLLENRIRWALEAVRAEFSWFDGLNQPRQTVLVEMAFNMGMGDATHGLKSFKNTLAAMRLGDYKKAAAGMRASKWARQVGQRADDLAEIMEVGRWPLYG